MTAPTTSGTGLRIPGISLLEALATPHGVDRYLELVHPMLTIREPRAEVTAVHRSTPDTVTLTLRPNRPWRGFTAGQYVRLSVDIDGVRRTRCYSPACSQHRPNGRIELTVKAHDGGLVSGHLHRDAAPGLVVGLSQAEGSFTLPDPRPERVVLISGGSGITPVLSMLRTLCDEGHRGAITFLHYARTEADVAHLADLRAIDAAHDNVDVVLAYTGQEHGGDLHGRFSAGHLRSAAPWHADARTFLCGPPGLMAAVREHYRAGGLADALHVEDFAPTSIPVPSEAATGTVRFDRSGIAADNSGWPLLEQAEAAGLTPDHGCRMGICFSCTRVKRSGRVRNALSGELSSEEDEEIQLCVNVPVGDVAIDL